MTATKPGTRPAAELVRCAIYTRKITEEGLDQEFNSLDAQRDAGEAYVRSRSGEGWARCRTGTTAAGSPAATPTAPGSGG
jgi:site-specific DNA recombinase